MREFWLNEFHTGRLPSGKGLAESAQGHPGSSRTGRVGRVHGLNVATPRSSAGAGPCAGHPDEVDYWKMRWGLVPESQRCVRIRGAWRNRLPLSGASAAP